MRMKIEDLDRALDDVLAASLMPSQWPSVLEAITEASGSVGGNILPIIGRSPGVPSTQSMGEAMEAYFEEGWHLNDYRMRGIPHLLRKGTMLEQDYAAEDVINNDSYYKFLARHKLRWSAIVGFERGPDLLVLALQRGPDAGPFSRREERVLLHMKERLTLASAMTHALTASKVDGMAEAFDLASVACIFFDRRGLVTRLNQQAEKYVGIDFHIARGEIRTSRPDETVALQNRIKSVLSSIALSNPAPPLPLHITRADKRPLIVRLQRLSGFLPDIFAHSAALAVIEDLDSKPKPQASTIQHVFGLTPAEAEIAILLASGCGAKDVSIRRSITYETARAHIRSIMNKTQTERQSDIASLISRLTF